MNFEQALWIAIGAGVVAGICFVCVLLRQKSAQRQACQPLQQTKLRKILDGTFDAICFVARDYGILASNPAFKKMLAPGESLRDLVFHDDHGLFESAWQRAIADEKPQFINLRMLDQQTSQPTMMDVALRPDVGDSAGNHDMVVHIRDVSLQHQHAEQLARSEQRFRDFAEASTDWLWEVDADLNFTYVSAGVMRTLGLPTDYILGRNLFDMLFDTSQSLTRDLIRSRVQAMQMYRDVEFWFEGRDGDKICLRISGLPIFDEKQIFKGYRGAVSNITATKQDQEHAFLLATTDHLTGLLNRTRLMEELDKATHFAERHSAEGMLVLIDVDQFKDLNDTYGHDKGDQLLKEIASLLRENTRATDVVARLGGDEFAIIMQEIAHDTARLKVQAIMDKIHSLQLAFSGDGTVGCTVSMGLMPFSGDAHDANNLMMRADMALYRAKDLGRNRIYMIGEEEQDGSEVIQARTSSLKEQLKWVDRLKHSLETGDFEVFYQALVPQTPSDIPYFEALIRLRDEHGRLGAPGVFIDAAEHHGLIKQLDLKMIERCITKQIAMKAQGHHVKISVNLSGKSLGDPQVIQELRDLIDRYPQLEPRDFTFEVTETAALHDPKVLTQMDKIQDFIDSLRSMGFRFALDDFGTGFSSFNYIKHLNVDCIKIDGSFILPLEKSKQDRLFVQAIVNLAKGLNMLTVAEFVENPAIMKVLQELGVDFVQGYHLSKPEDNLAALHQRFKGKCIDDFYDDAATSAAKPKKRQRVQNKTTTGKAVQS